jgi:hypothetical protein
MPGPVLSRYSLKQLGQFEVALTELTRLGDAIIGRHYQRFPLTTEEREKYKINEITALCVDLLFQEREYDAAQCLGGYLVNEKKWPLFVGILATITTDLRIKLKLKGSYPHAMHDFHDHLDEIEEVQNLKAWLYQKYDPKFHRFHRDEMRREFEDDDTLTIVELKDTVTEGDYNRHGRWHVVIRVKEWSYDALFVCERARLAQDHDDPSLKFTYLQGPRAGHEYYWTPGGEQGSWDRPLLGAIAWMPSRVCRFIFGMDEVSQDVDLSGTR